jgi:hypothetical protein
MRRILPSRHLERTESGLPVELTSTTTTLNQKLDGRIVSSYSNVITTFGSARESVKVLNWRGFLKTGALEFRGWVSTLGHGHGDLIEGGGDRSRPS